MRMLSIALLLVCGMPNVQAVDASNQSAPSEVVQQKAGDVRSFQPVKDYLGGAQANAIMVTLKDSTINLKARMNQNYDGDIEQLHQLKEESGQKFKAAVLSSEGHASLQDALKKLRGAEIALFDHVSPQNRSALDSAVGAVKVELELVE